MLALLLTLSSLSPALHPRASQWVALQGQDAAVEVRGDAELSPADALASARRRAEQHVRAVWRERGEREAALQRPGWIPALLTSQAVDRWVAALPVEQLLRQIERDDRERVHEFGRSYQTTLWIEEAATPAEQARRGLRDALRRAERVAGLKAAVVAAGWLTLGVVLAWLDRLSRGYMTGRLFALGVFGAASLPAVLFLV